MERTPKDAENMKRLAETGARMYHPMRQLVLCEPVEDGWQLVDPEPGVLDIDIEAERPGNTWNWSR